jgi:KaiC/GvpD/RAD55 family RecA-like ATPase
MLKKGRISTGVYGLDDMLGGGFRENSINIIHGGTGVGKTTFALQYSLFGLNHGEKVVYVSFEMTEEQIIRDCGDMEWREIEDHIDNGNLKIIHIFGEDLTFPSLNIEDMIKKSMPVKNLRIVVDPFTYPTFYSEKEKRKSLSSIFQEMRALGTTVVTLEEPSDGATPYNISSSTSSLSGESSAMPVYLADTVMHLQNIGFGEMYDRTFRIKKNRGSKHGEGLLPYTIETGLGIVLRTPEIQMERVRPNKKYDSRFTDAIEKVRSNGYVGEILSKRFYALKKNWTSNEDPSQILDLVIKEETKGYAKKS